MIDLSIEEKNALLECINTQIKASPNAIAAAETLLPIVSKLTAPVNDKQHVALADAKAEEQ